MGFRNTLQNIKLTNDGTVPFEVSILALWRHPLSLHQWGYSVWMIAIKSHIATYGSNDNPLVSVGIWISKWGILSLYSLSWAVRHDSTKAAFINIDKLWFQHGYVTISIFKSPWSGITFCFFSTFPCPCPLLPPQWLWLLKSKLS